MLHQSLISSGIADQVRRIVVGVTGDQAGPESSTSPSAVAWPPAPASSSRIPSIRGVHPLVGRRLHLWRLQNFHVTRVADLTVAPAGGTVPGGVLVYHCVAKENPDDQRLVALAQVYRFKAERDADGRITHIAGAEDGAGRLRRCDRPGPP